MELRAGTLFARLDHPNEPADRRHTWVIVSDPTTDPSAVLLVNFTDGAYWPDDACELQPGEHPCITKVSRVAYRFGETVTLARLRRDAEDGLLEPRGVLPAPLLRRIRLGAWQSIYIPDEHLDLLEAQGLGRDDL